MRHLSYFIMTRDSRKASRNLSLIWPELNRTAATAAQHSLDTSQYVHLQYLHLQECMTDQMQGQSNAAAAQPPPVCMLPQVTRILGPAQQLLFLEAQVYQVTSLANTQSGGNGKYGWG